VGIAKQGRLLPTEQAQGRNEAEGCAENAVEAQPVARGVKVYS